MFTHKAHTIFQPWSKTIKSLLPSQTQPKKMKKIIETLHLGKLSQQDPQISEFFHLLQKESVPVQDFIDKWLVLCEKNKPLSCFFNIIEKKNLIEEKEKIGLIDYMDTHLHVAVLFEALSVTMSNSKTFNEEVYNFIIESRHSPFPGNPLANFFLASGKNFDLAKNMKIVAVDPVMTSGAFYRSLNNLASSDEVGQKAREFVKKYRLNLWNAKINPLKVKSDESVKNIAINMLWAICNESMDKESSRMNAQAGCGLIALMEKMPIKNQAYVKNLILPEGESLLADNKYSLLPDLTVSTEPKVVSTHSIDKDWMDLYASWDLLFLIQAFGAGFLPVKLLVPSILGAMPVHYLESRVFLLFLMGNLFQTHQAAANPLFKVELQLENANLLKEEWAKINLQLVDELLKKHGCKSNCEEIYETIVGKRPSLALVRHIAEFAFDYESFALTKE